MAENIILNMDDIQNNKIIPQLLYDKDILSKIESNSFLLV